jgi:hypothetical protein
MKHFGKIPKKSAVAASARTESLAPNGETTVSSESVIGEESRRQEPERRGVDAKESGLLSQKQPPRRHTASELSSDSPVIVTRVSAKAKEQLELESSDHEGCALPHRKDVMNHPQKSLKKSTEPASPRTEPTLSPETVSQVVEESSWQEAERRGSDRSKENGQSETNNKDAVVEASSRGKRKLGEEEQSAQSRRRPSGPVDDIAFHVKGKNQVLETCAKKKKKRFLPKRIFPKVFQGLFSKKK